MRKFTLVTLSALIVVSLLSLAQVRGPVSAAQATPAATEAANARSC